MTPSWRVRNRGTDDHAHARLDRRRLAAHRHPGVPPRRHREGAREGHRGQPQPDPGLPGRRDPPPRRWRPRDVHGPQGQLRRRRGADLPGALADHRPPRGRHTWRCPAREAVLPARPSRQEGEDQGKARNRRQPLTRATLLRIRRAVNTPASDPTVVGTASGGTTAAATADPTTGSGTPDAPPDRSDSGRAFWKELPFLVVIALVLALLIKTFLLQAFYIPSASMENTLQGGPPGGGAPTSGHPYDRVLVNKLVYDFRSPHRGEIVVFAKP